MKKDLKSLPGILIISGLLAGHAYGFPYCGNLLIFMSLLSLVLIFFVLILKVYEGISYEDKEKLAKSVENTTLEELYKRKSVNVYFFLVWSVPVMLVSIALGGKMWIVGISTFFYIIILLILYKISSHILKIQKDYIQEKLNGR